jgi:hypothetical protein
MQCKICIELLEPPINTDPEDDNYSVGQNVGKPLLFFTAYS